MQWKVFTTLTGCVCAMPTKSVPGKGHVVVVEPDDLIRELLERWLVADSFTVSDLSSPRAAALVIISLPRPGQAEASLQEVRVRHGAVPILAISGRFRRGLAASGEAALRLGVNKVLPKPFTREELLLAVAESLHEGGGAGSGES
jgi:DNA-binding response OmpR family regulator